MMGEQCRWDDSQALVVRIEVAVATGNGSHGVTFELGTLLGSRRETSTGVGSRPVKVMAARRTPSTEEAQSGPFVKTMERAALTS